MVSRADVVLWGRRIGAVGLAAEREIAVFEYDDAFIQSGVEVSPIHMPLRGRRFAFPQLPAASFHGLPGLLADALPDRYGNALINAWLAQQGRAADSMNAVERLCYVGRRGRWSLAPAYDVTYSYNPSGRWTAWQQMTLGGKRDDFSGDDFRACARLVGLKRGRAVAIMDEVATALRRWPEFADAAGVAPAWAEEVRRNHRERGAGDIIDSSSGRTVSFPAAAAAKRGLPTTCDGPDQG